MLSKTKHICSNKQISASIELSKLFSTTPDFSSFKLETQNCKISWYPGHIAKAEKELQKYLKLVDVVIEVRDARIPISTAHPLVTKWIGKKPLIVAMARLDQVTKHSLAQWKAYCETINSSSFHFIEKKSDGKKGLGINPLRQEALLAGKKLNERRVRQGMQPRAVRAAVIGFPNVGKSALINRLLGRKMAPSRNLPGLTRSLQWVRLGGPLVSNQEDIIELLDSPGIIPGSGLNQLAAVKLAICNDIGEASYDKVNVACAMCDLINHVSRNPSTRRYGDMRLIERRYDMAFSDMSGEDIVFELAEKRCDDQLISAADKLLADFRKGMLGSWCLEGPPPAALLTTSKTPTLIRHQDIIIEDPEDDLDILPDIPDHLDAGIYDGW